MGGFNPQSRLHQVQAVTGNNQAHSFVGAAQLAGLVPTPKPLVAPPPPPDLTDAAVKAARAGQLNQLLSARGRRSTFLTQPPLDLGSPFPSLNSSAPPAGGKTFLGQ